MKAVFATLASSTLLSSSIYANGLDDWDERSFKGRTQYELISIDGGNIIKGSTDGQASVLYKEQETDLLKTPVIRWRWRIENTYDPSINEMSKQGDDYPARLYVVAKTGFLPWQTLAINYVWSSNQPIDTHWPNAYTDNAQMLVLDTGTEFQGQWRLHTRNIKKDFARLFAKDIDKIDGYAIMIDGDNTGSKGTAWFADIEFQNTNAN